MLAQIGDVPGKHRECDPRLHAVMRRPDIVVIVALVPAVAFLSGAPPGSIAFISKPAIRACSG
ncbi:MAG: hypothetical protein ACREE5_04690 [Acetobacteraceae bacterium]